MKKLFYKIFILTLLLVVAVENAMAINWTGNVSSDWNNSANWSRAPANGSALVINPTNYTGVAASPVVSSASAFTAATITVSGGGFLTISHNLTCTTDLIITGASSRVLVTAGTVSAYRFLLNNAGSQGVTKLDVTGGAITFNSNFLWKVGTNGTSTNQINISGGTLTANGSFQQAAGPGTKEIEINVSGSGVFNLNAYVEFSTANDIFNQTGGIINFSNNTWTSFGTFTSTAGTVNIVSGTVSLAQTGSWSFYNLTIASGAIFNQNTPNNINVAGNWTNNHLSSKTKPMETVSHSTIKKSYARFCVSPKGNSYV